MRRDPSVTLVCYGARKLLRYLEARGTVVEMTEAGAAEHLDNLPSKHGGLATHHFGDGISARFAETAPGPLLDPGMDAAFEGCVVPRSPERY